MIDNEIREKYREAGRIAGEARDLGASLVRPGAKLLDVAEKVESYIRDSGAGVAFPINLSINDQAAHYTPMSGEETVFEEGDLVKVDVGAHVDGYIGDTARTVEVGEEGKWSHLITAAERALSLAVELVCPGADLSLVGEAIEDEIKTRGYIPIKNLTGHSLQQYNLHAGLTIPNVAGYRGGRKLKTGDVIAIEPFTTNGMGHVENGPNGNIYQFTRLRPVRHSGARALLQSVHKEYNKLPFSERGCAKAVPERIKRSFALKLLSRDVLIRPYSVLMEAGGGMVAQAEHTVMIVKDGCEVLTSPNWF